VNPNSPNPAAVCANRRLQTDSPFFAPQDSHHVGFPEAFRLSTKMLLFCHNSLSKQMQVDPCDLPMHSCMENRYFNSLIHWRIASGQADIAIVCFITG